MPKGTRNPDNTKMTLNFRENVQLLRDFESVAKAQGLTAPQLAVQCVAREVATWRVPKQG